MLDTLRTSTAEPFVRTSPSPALLVGAFAGLLGVALGGAGCSSDPKTADVADAGGCTTDTAPPDAQAASDADAPDVSLGDSTASADAAVDVGAGDGRYVDVTEDATMTYAQFPAMCTARAGFVQTTASCAGNNSCRGFSYLGGEFMEHSCRAMNACGPGMSCVLTAPDEGRTGQQVYEADKACAGTCHGDFSVDPFDPKHFTLYVRPGTVSLSDAKSRFLTGSKDRLMSIIAFGAHGINDDGSAYANMPAYFDRFSRAEIGRVVDYIRGLPLEVKYYTVSSAPDAADAGVDAPVAEAAPASD
jgi:hypothetical protein